MKKYLFLFVAVVSLALSSGQAYAQRYLPKMKGVDLRGGFVNGSKSPLNYYTGIAMSGYTKKANRWVVGAEYQLKNYDYRGTSVPRAQFTAEGGYYLKFLSDPTKTFFLSIGGSALAGYETVNWGDRLLHDGSTLLAKDAFIYGGAITLVSIKLKFRPSTIEGKAGSLYYQVIYMRKVRQVATSFRITQSEWDSELEEVIIKDDDSSRTSYLQYVQNHIEYDKGCFKRIVKKLTISDAPFTVDTIVDEFHKQSSEITLFSYMEKMIGKLWRQGQHRTSETYQATLNSFRKFREGVDVCFDDIDSEMLISYEYHLRAKELAPNTISFYMKRLRAVYNNAVEDGYVENKNPFKKVFTSSEKTVKRAIPLKYVRKLKDLDLSYSPSKSFARDMFLFSFYTRGMSFVDMAYLQKKNLKDNVLTYRRKKTGQLLSIRWEDCMEKIVNQYSSLTSPYLISIIKDPAGNTRKQYHNVLTLINHNLKSIGKELGLALPLTMYVARHSWASIARDEGIPISVISEGMGHDSESTTQIYLASLETQVIDKANKKILKLL